MTVATSFAFEPAEPSEAALYNARLIPAPKSTQFRQGIVALNARLTCVFILPQESLTQPKTLDFTEDLKSAVKSFSGVEISPTLSSAVDYLEVLKKQEAADPNETAFINELIADDNFWGHKEAYKIRTFADSTQDWAIEKIVENQNELSGKLLIAASDVDGIRNAFKTLLQLSETFGNSGSTQTSRYFVPETAIDDEPAIAFRGLHLCWFPETDKTRIEQAIRIAAYYKFNYVVLEFWGTFPFESTAGLTWNEFHTDKEDIRRLVQLGKKLGVKLIPQLNLFGHATGARVSVGKHTTLDFTPEMEPLFEPDGWTWNIYNPAARELLTNCMLELYETFDSPEFFHIGCDEAYSAGTGFLARRQNNYVEALADWLTYFHDVLKERNCRVMMWHDMLVESADFKGYVVGGNVKTRGLVNKLPKDILICDWQYGTPKEKETWPTSEYFQNKGFEFVACPWTNVSGIKSLANNVIQKQGFGLLCTTWHMFYGGNMVNILVVGAQSCWGTTYQGSGGDKNQSFNRHLRQASCGIPDKTYRTNGVNDWQVIKETVGPQG